MHDAVRREPPDEARRRVLVENVEPTVDGGRYAAKRIVGDGVDVACDLVADGHDVIAGRVLFRRVGERAWQSAPLEPAGNDRYRGSFLVSDVGRWEFTIEAWLDTFTTWRHGTEKKLAGGQPIDVELLAGARLLEEGAARQKERQEELGAGAALTHAARTVRDGRTSARDRFAAATSEAVLRAMTAAPDLSNATRCEPSFEVVVDPPLARFGAWYELFPRSCGRGGAHGTFADVVRRLDDLAEMGFDVLYLPPIHPIGRAFRKGRNNALEAGPDDPGSPWAIGAAEGGHKSVHPELGTLDDFRELVRQARARNIAIALDVAFQVSPDHPYVTEHPDWFVRRADGSLQYAENPPKKYQDVVPFDFECEDWKNLWLELESVFSFWIAQGVRVFRVDNPHTKSLRFWRWCIEDIKRRAPDTIFLAEAFTRPKVMYALAKAGFSQSYTYFTWRRTKADFESYMRELSRAPVAEFFRPNFWPNTPDILPEDLQYGGRPTFLLRLVLAATLSSNYGIYGPPFERMEHVARSGSEDYLDSEKFEIRRWDTPFEGSLRDAIRAINAIRRAHPALQQTTSIAFHDTSDPSVLAFSKSWRGSTVVVVANLDPRRTCTVQVTLDRAALGMQEGDRVVARELLSGDESIWTDGAVSFTLEPSPFPAKIVALTKRARAERDFEYYL